MVMRDRAQLGDESREWPGGGGHTPCRRSATGGCAGGMGQAAHCSVDISRWIGFTNRCHDAAPVDGGSMPPAGELTPLGSIVGQFLQFAKIVHTIRDIWTDLPNILPSHRRWRYSWKEDRDDD
ncbi:hypothetical protein NDU88_002900 [Pleurodeles waltl]|uniref:Uncharacterized protein n=1 Tax=Pleurodeles waltl TaxID=8319 RepID=A0AAV7P9M6_PLEWA|nr:hypothetical protein NDU88_002900 [Pleurodeles waltl]